jgi:MoaA/NifB/PqqE/SkfB family radical SAM enzyme
MTEDMAQVESPYGPPRLTLELANACNLHCAYCLRDEDALYHARPRFIDLDFMQRLLRDSSEIAGVTEVCFTGGEPTLHPQFQEALQACASHGMKVAFITNGWNFAELCGPLNQSRDSLTHIAFSIDGTTAKAHDRWRGKGSFERLIRAFSYCQKYELPFVIKTGIRRDTVDHLEDIAMFAARFGANGLAFAHLMPTSLALEQNLALTMAERRRAEEEIALLRRIFKMKIGIDVGYYNIDPAAPCAPLAGSGLNVDYQGRLTLCCNMSGFRGGSDESDIIADLNQVAFADAYSRFLELGNNQLELRKQTLAAMREDGVTPDLQTGSPCLFCLRTFGKSPWQKSTPAEFVNISSSLKSVPSA